MEALTKLKELFKSEKFYIGFGILVFGIIVMQLFSLYLYHSYPTLPTLRDSILDNLPTIRMGWIYDLLIFISIAIFVVYAFRKDYKKIPYFLFLFGVLSLIRGLFMALTPFANPDLSIYQGISSSGIFNRGVYPSGHTGSGFIAYLLASGVYRKVLLFFAIAIIISLLLAHGHYSIDIFSAIIFAYAVYMMGEKHFKKILCLE